MPFFCYEIVHSAFAFFLASIGGASPASLRLARSSSHSSVGCRLGVFSGSGLSSGWGGSTGAYSPEKTVDSLDLTGDGLGGESGSSCDITLGASEFRLGCLPLSFSQVALI